MSLLPTTPSGGANRLLRDCIRCFLARRGRYPPRWGAGGIFFAPSRRVTDCRDPKDNLYLELALASGAHTIVSSDQDLLVLHPWRGVRILRPAEYLANLGAPP